MSGLEWRLYYEDGSIFSNEDGPPEASPAWGVVVIAQRVGKQHNNILWSGVPWNVYRTDLGFWTELDDIGFHDILVNKAHLVSAIRPGRYMQTDRFMSIVKQAEGWVHG
jgi:hypothetical protein